MKLKESHLVWWEENDKFMIGKLLVGCENNQVITIRGGMRIPQSISTYEKESVLVRHCKEVDENSHVVESFVKWTELFHYYNEKAPELYRHHVSMPRFTDLQLIELKSMERIDTKDGPNYQKLLSGYVNGTDKVGV